MDKNNVEKTKVVAVVGPTGVGKTAASLKLAKALDGEIISCDSMQVYKGMDIGTAKIMPEEMDGIVHHLIDIQEYDQPYNVKIFQEKCREAIADIVSRNKTPILCGGTGLYVKAALYDYEFRQDAPDPLKEEYVRSLSPAQLVALLKAEDPKSLESIHPNNIKRLQRAALLALSGKNKSQREEAQEHIPLYDVYFAGLCADKELVDRRIEDRVEAMFSAGLPEEVKDLFTRPETWKYTSFQGIGYKEFLPWLQKEGDLEQVKRDIVVHSRQYAKRQMTWFRNQMPVHWFDISRQDEIIPAVEAWYEQ